MTSKERFLRAIRGEPVDRPPVWIMRQAGRTLPEYRALREKYSFWELCRTPELAAQVTLQPLRRFPLDAAIIFSDILVIPAAMGMDVGFSGGLSLSPVVRSERDVRRLKTGGIESALSYVPAAIRLVADAVGDDTAVLGFSGAPFTLAAYMTAGKSERSFTSLRSLMYHSPDLFNVFMEKLAAAVETYLLMQAAAGVTAVQLFDTWAGELSRPVFERFVLPYVERIVRRLESAGIPVIYYINGGGHLLEAMAASGAAVLGVDWRIPLQEARTRAGTSVCLQGNLDPAMLLTDPDTIRRSVFDMLDQTGGRSHIVNLGHGLLPETPVDHIRVFLDAVTARKKEPSP